MARPRLSEAFDTPEQKRRYVRRLFATIAARYDLITVLLSFGLDRRWKRRLALLADIDAGVRVLDLACGTGDITYELASRGAAAIGLDVTPRMLELARAKRHRARAQFVLADMMQLPFADGRFDLVTSGYGIRNVPQLEPALAEACRVLRPGGRFLTLDFNRPDNRLLRAIYLTYLTIVGSALGFTLHGDPDTYRYIPESIRRYPGARGVCDRARTLGFSSCQWFPVLGGLLAIHLMIKGAERLEHDDPLPDRAAPERG